MRYACIYFIFLLASCDIKVDWSLITLIRMITSVWSLGLLIRFNSFFPLLSIAESFLMFCDFISWSVVLSWVSNAQRLVRADNLHFRLFSISF